MPPTRAASLRRRPIRASGNNVTLHFNDAQYTNLFSIPGTTYIVPRISDRPRSRPPRGSPTRSAPGPYKLKSFSTSVAKFKPTPSTGAGRLRTPRSTFRLRRPTTRPATPWPPASSTGLATTSRTSTELRLPEPADQPRLVRLGQHRDPVVQRELRGALGDPPVRKAISSASTAPRWPRRRVRIRGTGDLVERADPAQPEGLSFDRTPHQRPALAQRAGRGQGDG